MQLNCLFWNAGRKAPNEQVVRLAVDTKASLIALAEYDGSGLLLLRELTQHCSEFFLVPTIGCERIHILSTYPPSYFIHRREANRYTIKELRIPGATKVLLCVTHLPSKLHSDSVDQLHTASFLKADIEYSEKEAEHENTVVFGDFNMNPFDEGMVSAGALNSLPCLNTARRRSREIDGREHLFFYNPTWNLLGDFSGPPGTYYHGSPGYMSHYWNTVDQVVIRPEMATRFLRDAFAVLTSDGEKPLVSEKGRPNVSDHLPITFALDLS